MKHYNEEQDDNGYYQRKKRLSALRRRNAYSFNDDDKDERIKLHKGRHKPRKKVAGDVYAENVIKWLEKVEK